MTRMAERFFPSGPVALIRAYQRLIWRAMAAPTRSGSFANVCRRD
jgi:hypothetical protein